MKLLNLKPLHTCTEGARACLLSYCFLVTKKQLLKALLTCTFIPSLLSSESRKKYTLRLLLTCREALEEELSFFPWRNQDRVSRNLFSLSKAVPEDLNMKFRSKSNRGYTNRGCLHSLILSLQDKRSAIFPSECSE